mmetsp:Transcript_10660/g.20982  ORF Transcript_10660/g.20982 Transcript_10660/m.20982 type:complete len:264 (-) Transcript_10660:1915-2706(-)
MGLIFSIKVNHLRKTLRTRPKRVALAVCGILWIGSDERDDGVAKESVEQEKTLLDTCGIAHVRRRRLGEDMDDRAKRLDLHLDGRETLARFLNVYSLGLESLNPFLRRLDEVRGFGSSRSELVLKASSGPLRNVFDSARKVTQGTHWNSITCFILRAVRIGAGKLGYNGLTVTLCTKSSTLEQRLVVKHTLAIHIKTSLHVVESVGNKIQRLPEIIIENVFGIRSHEVLLSNNFHRRVHIGNRFTGSNRLRLANVVLTEQELA